jgi:membrane protease YdiL (CAAX protease family)
MFSNLLRALFVLLLVAGVPALSYSTARPSRIRLIPRSALYVSAVLSQWLLGALGGLVIWATLPGPPSVGLRAIPPGSFFGWTALLTLVSVAGIAVMAWLEHVGWWPQESEITRLLLPETLREKLLAVLLVAPSAGICEELLYRGYLLPQLSQYLSSATWGWVASSAAFGLAHGYQGVSGMLQAALLGALLAYPMVRTGSVYPAMAAHFLIDALLLVWLGRKLLRTGESESTPAGEEGRSSVGSTSGLGE